MTTEAKVGAFVLGCFAILAFTVIYLVNAQMNGERFRIKLTFVTRADWSRVLQSCLVESKSGR